MDMNTAGIIGMGMPGTPEILLIIFIILLLFGAKKLPELSRSIGKSLGEFKKGQKDGFTPDKEDAEKTDIDPPDEPDFKK
jgi:sec-independent protein translocase protein TatA